MRAISPITSSPLMIEAVSIDCIVEFKKSLFAKDSCGSTNKQRSTLKRFF